MPRNDETTDTRKSSGAGMRILDVLCTLALLAGVGYAGYYVAKDLKEVDNLTNYDIAAEPEETTEAVDENKIIFDSIKVNNNDMHAGNLILVNKDAAFAGGYDDLVSLYQVMLEQDIHSFGVKDGEVQVRQEMAENLIAMFEGFAAATSDTTIVVQGGYRSAERQQELYDADLAATGLDYSESVSMANHSEHQTGWCVDLTRTDGEYDGTDVYSWVNEHCHEYGMILRYPEDKTGVTGISYEPWHYRYVGKPHAYYMQQNALCLEEYMELLHAHPYDGEHLQVTDADGRVYEIYFCPADAANETTMLPVPTDLPYRISGNNTDGFIVTAELEAAPEENPEAVPEENLENPEAAPEENPENPEVVPEENPENPEAAG